MSPSFDELARGWDEVPARAERAAAAAARIRERVSLGPGALGLEFGCGTGLLGFLLRDLFATIYLVDSSAGMIEVLGGKIRASGATNMVPVLGDMDSPELADRRFDLACALMVLHHVADTAGIVGKLGDRLGPGGYLCVVDLEKEDGSFHRHEEGFAGHDGFETGALAGIFERAGLAVRSCEIVYHAKRVFDGAERLYPIFLMVGQKPGERQ